MKKIISLIFVAIIFQSCESYESCRDYEPFQAGLWRLDTDENSLRLIKFRDSGDFSLLGVMEKQGESNIFLRSSAIHSLRLDGSNEKELISHFSEPPIDLSLSSQGNKVVFASPYENYLLNPDSTEGNSYRSSDSELWIANLDSDEHTEEILIRNDSTDRTNPDHWTFTDHMNPFLIEQSNSIIHISERKTYAIDNNFELSSEPTDIDYGIWMTNIENSEKKRVTSEKYFVHDFALNSDFTKIAFSSTSGVYIQEISDSTSSKLIFKGRKLKFSPDDNLVAYLYGSQLHVYNFETDTKTKLTPEEQQIDEFSFTNDSKQIVYIYAVPYQSDRGIAIVDIDGTGQKKLAVEDEHNKDHLDVDNLSDLFFSPNNNFAFYIASGQAYIPCN